ncbi:threonine dehydratase [Desulfohalotomaculum tongense]|uniref:threonine ammonia-lyase n=1 Tax=Desulforadius tongensis TaxID=1216062 RepID=UPI00195BD724|nr:threonine ammonia-lyase [Desulforadius tongensis]MBM7854618.1 threonine dehydratase [Desulforadius tongensis]
MNSVSLEDIKAARRVLAGVVRKTDVIYSPINELCSCEVYLKLENLQQTGSFKIRGAYNKIYNLTPEQRAKGVIASSAGNHAQGVALAASAFGIKSTIVMPETAPLAKITATKGYGAEVILHGNVYDDTYAKAVEIQNQTGAVFIHPFDNPHTIAGQGTIALEILEDIPDIDAIIVPIGGGGLIAGIALAAKAINPDIKIIGVEASNAASMKKSVEEGKLVSLTSAATIADGIAVKTPGKLTYQIASRYVDDFVTVDEDEIANAILMLLERFKLVAEGAGAASMAAVASGKVKMPGKKVVAVISGGNIDVNVLSRIVDKGLAKAGRKTELSTIVLDKPGRLQEMLKVISDMGANIVEIHHNRISLEAELGCARVDLVIETQDNEHLEMLLKELKNKGYKVDRV